MLEMEILRNHNSFFSSLNSILSYQISMFTLIYIASHVTLIVTLISCLYFLVKLLKSPKPSDRAASRKRTFEILLFAYFVFYSVTNLSAMLWLCLQPDIMEFRTYMWGVLLQNMAGRMSFSGLILCFLELVTPLYCRISQTFITENSSKSFGRLGWKSFISFLGSMPQRVIFTLIAVFSLFPLIGFIFVFPPLAQLDYPLLLNADYCSSWGLILLIPLLTLILLPFSYSLLLILYKTRHAGVRFTQSRIEILRLFALILIVLFVSWSWFLTHGLITMKYDYSDYSQDKYLSPFSMDKDSRATLIQFLTNLTGFFAFMRFQKFKISCLMGKSKGES